MTDHQEGQDKQDEGGSPHTSPEEGHPAGTGERTDRDIGGPTAPEDGGDGDETGGGPSPKPADEGFDSHQ
ncbi:MAG TPA: hypothetical protein VF517_11120 [Thermoleophilaceae bacterium]|jgi:hypothetical protein